MCSKRHEGVAIDNEKYKLQYAVHNVMTVYHLFLREVHRTHRTLTLSRRN